MADTQYTEQIVREAPQIEAYKLGLLQSAKGLSDQPVNLPGYQVAGFGPDQLKSFDLARQGIGAYQPYLYGGSQALQQGLGTTQEAADVLRGADTRNQYLAAQQAMNLGGQAANQLSGIASQINPAFAGVSAGQMAAVGAMGQYDPRSVGAFMDPFQQQVIQAANQEINRQRDIAAQQQNAQAVGAGAFGGSRQAIQRAELERNTATQRNQLMANLLSQGYTQAQAQAQSAFEQGQQRNLGVSQALGQLAGQQGALTGQQANILGQQAGLYGTLGQGIGALAGQQFGVGQQMAQGLGQFGAQLGNLGVQQAALGQSAQQLGQGDVSFLYGLGQQQQALTQQQLDAQRNTALQQAYEPYQRLSFLSDIYKGAPSSQQSISAATAPTPSVFQQAAGIGISGLAAAAGAKKAGLF